MLILVEATDIVFILGFVGTKMLLAEVVHIPTALSLAVIAGALVIAVASSWHAEPKTEEPIRAR